MYRYELKQSRDEASTSIARAHAALKSALAEYPEAEMDEFRRDIACKSRRWYLLFITHSAQ